MTLLDKDGLSKLKVTDENGNDVPESVASISMAGYNEWDEENEKDVYHELEDLFFFHVFKTGDYRIVYDNGDETSMVSINANMPSAAIFGTKVAKEKYIIAGDNTTYGKGRRTFYILPMGEEHEDYERIISVVSKARGNSSDAVVKTDIETGIVTVTIAEDATDDIGVQVRYKESEAWYHDEDGERVLNRDENNPDYRNPLENDFDQWFWFHPEGEVVEYPQEVQEDIDAANAFKNCKKLRIINLYAKNLKKIGKNAFKFIKKNARINIYVADKKIFNKIKKMIKKSKASKVRYSFKKSNK